MVFPLITAIIAGEDNAPNVVSLSDTSSTGLLGNTAGFMFSSTGEIYTYYHGFPISTSYWLAPQTNIDQYEIRATVLSGDTPDGTIGTWDALTTNQYYSLTAPPATLLSCELTIEIRWTGNNVVQDSATYTITSSAP